MARTRTVNPKKRKSSSSSSTKKRKSNPRRSYGSAKRRSAPRRRRPAAPARRTRRRPARKKNPRDIMDFDHALKVGPPATLGVVGARWALKQAGPLETPAGGGAARPGFTHAIWGYLMARLGGNMAGNLFGDTEQGDAFEIAALGFLGDVFLRYNFFSEPDSWYRRNVFLGDGSPYRRQFVGRTDPYRQAAMGRNGANAYTDATGQTYVRTPHGWRLAGNNGGNNGRVAGFSMRSPIGQGPPGPRAPHQLAGFSMRSPIGQSGGYLEQSQGYGAGNLRRSEPIKRLYGGDSFVGM